jgi:hypothetical protein
MPKSGKAQSYQVAGADVADKIYKIGSMGIEKTDRKLIRP